MKTIWIGLCLSLTMMLATFAYAEQYKQWSVNCNAKDQTSSQQICEAAYFADIEQDGERVPVFRLSISNLEDEDGKFLIVFAPHTINLFLPQNGKIMVGGNEIHQFQWSNCTPDGCWSHSRLSKDAVLEMRRKNRAMMLLQLSNGKQLNVNFSLAGISRALDELNKSK